MSLTLIVETQPMRKASSHKRLPFFQLISLVLLLIIVVAGILYSPLLLILLGTTVWISMVALVYTFPWQALCGFLFVLALIPNYVGVVLGLATFTATRVLSTALFAGMGLHYITHPKLQKGHRLDIYIVLFSLGLYLPMLFHTGVYAEFSGPLGVARQILWWWLDFGLYYFFVSRYVNSLARFRNFLLTLLRVAALVGALGIIEFVIRDNFFLRIGPQIAESIEQWGHLLFRGGLLRIAVSFGHPLSLGMFMALVLTLSIALLYTRTRHWLGTRLMMGIVLLAMLFTLSRAPILGGLLGVALFWITGIDGRWRAKLGTMSIAIFVGFFLFMVAIAGMMVVPGVTSQAADIVNGLKDTTNLQWRLYLLQPVWQAFQSSPFVGLGNIFQTDLFGQYEVFPGVFINVDVVNYFFLLLVRGGLVSLVPFVLVLLTSAKQLLRGLKLLPAGELRIYHRVALAGLGVQAFLFFGISDIGLAMHFVWIFVGLIVALNGLVVQWQKEQANQSLAKTAQET